MSWAAPSASHLSSRWPTSPPAVSSHVPCARRSSVWRFSSARSVGIWCARGWRNRSRTAEVGTTWCCVRRRTDSQRTSCSLVRSPSSRTGVLHTIVRGAGCAMDGRGRTCYAIRLCIALRRKQLSSRGSHFSLHSLSYPIKCMCVRGSELSHRYVCHGDRHRPGVQQVPTDGWPPAMPWMSFFLAH